jgi:hypothetical protein
MRRALAIFISLIASLAACAGPGDNGIAGAGQLTTVAVNSATLPSLPLPDRILASQSPDWPRWKSAYDCVALPGYTHFIKPDGSNMGMWFQPLNSEYHFNKLSGLAYCLYQFYIPCYDGDPQVRCQFNWTYPEAWVGLANRQNDCWDWYQLDEEGVARTKPLYKYAGSSGVVDVVVASATDTLLIWLRVGSNYLPQTFIYAQPESGTAPLQVSFLNPWDGADRDGYVVNSEWDFEGTGNFESHSEFWATHTYEAAGQYSVTVRVTDNEGGIGTSTAIYTVLSP